MLLIFFRCTWSGKTSFMESSCKMLTNNLYLLRFFLYIQKKYLCKSKITEIISFAVQLYIYVYVFALKYSHTYYNFRFFVHKRNIYSYLHSELYKFYVLTYDRWSNSVSIVLKNYHLELYAVIYYDNNFSFSNSHYLETILKYYFLVELFAWLLSFMQKIINNIAE